MKILGITIKLVIEVDDTMAGKFKNSPAGFLTLAGEPLGAEDLKVGLVNDEAVSPVGMQITVKELLQVERLSFLSD